MLDELYINRPKSHNFIKNKKTFSKIMILFLLFVPFFKVSAYKTGACLQLSSDFSGSLTLPKMTDDDLYYLNQRATEISGTVSNLIMGGEVEAGYVFRSRDLFNIKENNPFSGIGIFAYLGFSQGNTSQKITAVENGESFDIFISVDFLPVINFGLIGKSYFFDNKLALGLGLGGRAITDMSPEYLCYSTDPDVIETEIGTVIVTDEMMKKMNPLMFSTKFIIEYNVDVLPTTGLVLGAFLRYNIYRPKYLTVPPTLVDMATQDNPDFDVNRKFPDYWINSFDFGVRLGFVFKL